MPKKVTKKGSTKVKPKKKTAKNFSRSEIVKKTRKLGKTGVAQSKHKQRAKTNAIAISNKSRGSLPVKLADNPLDVYFSPHIIDLSQSRYIEKVKSKNFLAASNSQIDYRDLPGADILSKFYLFDLLEFEKSPIIRLSNFLFKKIKFKTQKPFQKVNLNPKLTLDNTDYFFGDSRSIIWRELVLVDLLFNFSNVLIEAYSVFEKALIYAKNQLLLTNKIDKLDELVDLSAKNKSERQFLIKEEIIKYDQPQFESIFKLFDEGNSTAEPMVITTEFLVKPIESIRDKSSKKSRLDFNFNPRFFYVRSLIWSVILVFLALIPIKAFVYWQDANAIKGQILGETESAVSALKMAQSELYDMDWLSAQDYFVQAKSSFISAQGQINSIDSFVTFLAKIGPQNAYKSGSNLIQLGNNLSTAAEYLLTGMVALSQAESEVSLTEKIKVFRNKSKDALVKMEEALANLKAINLNHIPENNRSQFLLLEEKLPLFISSLQQTKDLSNWSLDFLGDNELRRYLLIFQNDNELRPSGGFMGSFALIDVVNGQIRKLELPKGGTYDLEYHLQDNLQPPEALQLVNERWEFQDLNWWADWPTSAQKISSFYSRNGGVTVDGVIAINSDWFANLLTVTGPIDMPDYNKVIMASNVEQELQKTIELEYEDRSQPKTILADLADKLLDKLIDTNLESISDLALVINQGLANKDLLVYMAKEETQQFVVENNWDGGFKESPKDYLAVVAANIGGGKTDQALSQNIYHQAYINNDGSIINEVVIERNHFGPIDENFTNSSNRSYIRVYVPLGSQLISAAGFNSRFNIDTSIRKAMAGDLSKDPDLAAEGSVNIDSASGTKVYQEGNKTVFANWLVVAPGETKEVVLRYRLPFSLDTTKQSKNGHGNFLSRISSWFDSKSTIYDSYSLLLQKQPGSDEGKFLSTVYYDSNWTDNLVYPGGRIRSGDSYLTYQDQINNDLFYFIGFKYQ